MLLVLLVHQNPEFVPGHEANHTHDEEHEHGHKHSHEYDEVAAATCYDLCSRKIAKRRSVCEVEDAPGVN